MAPPTRDKKHGVSASLDPKSRIQKPANKAERAKPFAETLKRSVEKVITVAEESAILQDSQAVASSFEQPSGLTMEIDAESEDESTIEDFTPSQKYPHLKVHRNRKIMLWILMNITVLKRSTHKYEIRN